MKPLFTPFPRSPGRSSTAATLVGALLAALAVGCTGMPPAASVPAALDPGPATRLLTTLSASGVQVYECRAAAGAAPGWAFVAPEATLYDHARRRVGEHGAGPHWTLLDGSRIVGSLRARADAPSPGAIPWLLLETRSTGAPGRLAAVSRVQRVDTDGGLPPADGCDAQRLGAKAQVPYRADYRLFVPA